MAIFKEMTKDNELYLYMNGRLIFKRWLNGEYSTVFDVMAYSKYTYMSISEKETENGTEVTFEEK